MKTQLKYMVDRHVPALGRIYRELRDSRARQRTIETPYGFKFRGPPMFADPRWEIQERSAIQQGILSSDAFVDVGANCGYYSLMAAASARPVLAVEPLPANLELLRANIELNSFSTVEVLPIGLAPEPGQMQIHGHGDRASFVAGWGGVTDKTPVSVPVDTLDNALAERFAGKRLFIKVDVEGFEIQVLRGATRTLGRKEPTTWIMEVLVRSLSPDAVRETFAMFFAHGYYIEAVNAERTPVKPGDVQKWLDGSAQPPAGNFIIRK